MDVLVSVIVPVYNVDKYLHKCLDSILAQVYRNIEVIIVDDGSTDDSSKICDEYASKYNNFHVIHKANSGLGMARNTGMERMNGDYVMFVDSDDYIEPECVEVLLNNLQKYRVDVCKAAFCRVTNEGNVIATKKYDMEYFEGGKARTDFLPRLIGARPDRKDSLEMCVCGCIYNTKPIKKHRLQFPSERELIAEDLVFNIDYMQYANGACVISDIIYNYRINLSSLTNTYRKDRFEACCFLYRELKNKMESLGYEGMTILRLQRIFFVYLRACIKQENINVSGLEKAKAIGNIKEICKNQMVKNIIRSYPKSKLGMKQVIFLYLIYYHQYHLIYILVEHDLM